MLVIPKLSDHIIQCARELNCSWIGGVRVTPKPHCKEWDCHNNTVKYVSWYGGIRILGYYLLQDIKTNRVVAILHSIVRRENGQLVDITPFDDERSYNMFCMLKDQTPNYTRPEVWFKMDVTENTFSGLSL